MSDKISNLTTDTFKNAVASSATPVLVDFWAPWCGPCKAIAPVLDELATEFDGKISIAKVNIDENESIAAEYGIRAIPTMLIFKGGKVVEQIVGMLPKAALKSKLAAAGRSTGPGQSEDAGREQRGVEREELSRVAQQRHELNGAASPT
jgi:thioredoxin 1